MWRRDCAGYVRQGDDRQQGKVAGGLEKTPPLFEPRSEGDAVVFALDLARVLELDEGAHHRGGLLRRKPLGHKFEVEIGNVLRVVLAFDPKRLDEVHGLSRGAASGSDGLFKLPGGRRVQLF